MRENEAKRDIEESEEFLILNSYNQFSFLQPQKTQSKEWSMVVIRDSLPQNDYFIFPPANHENLHLHLKRDQEQKNPATLQSYSSSSFSSSSSSPSPSSSLASFSPSDDDISGPPSPMFSDHEVRKPKLITGWMAIGIEVVRSKIVSIASKFGVTGLVGGAFRSFGPATRIVVVVVIWWLYMRARRHRRNQRESLNQLRLNIKEKDEKICQLLRQIADLNQLLLPRQNSVASK